MLADPLSVCRPTLFGEATVYGEFGATVWVIVMKEGFMEYVDL